jgi:DNA polymerase
MSEIPAATFFDDIIKTLTIESETAKFANISENVLRDFHTDIPNANVNGESTTSPAAQPALVIQPPRFDAPAQPPPPPPQVVPPENIARMDMSALLTAARGCAGCSLRGNRENLVFGAGSVTSDLMFIGEAPGGEEDRQGVPFVGEAGQLLTKMINAMGFSRSEVYIANIVKCRPPGNRAPEDDEAAACLPFLHRQIELVNPKVIVLLGAVALKYLLGKTGITRARGVWMNHRGVKVMPTFHPAYLLRNPKAKKEVWEDLQKVMAVFGKTRSPISGR